MSGLRKAQNPMTVNAANEKSDDPAAKPSKPSVRFTALVLAMISSTAHTTQPTWPKSMFSRVEFSKESFLATLAGHRHVTAEQLANHRQAQYLVAQIVVQRSRRCYLDDRCSRLADVFQILRRLKLHRAAGGSC